MDDVVDVCAKEMREQHLEIVFPWSRCAGLQGCRVAGLQGGMVRVIG